MKRRIFCLFSFLLLELIQGISASKDKTDRGLRLLDEQEEASASAAGKPIEDQVRLHRSGRGIGAVFFPCNDADERQCRNEGFHLCNLVRSRESQFSVNCGCTESSKLVAVKDLGCLPCQEENTAYIGGNIYDHPLQNVESPEECKSKCQMFLSKPPSKDGKTCRFWTYEAREQKCYLKFDRRSEGGVVSWSGYTSGLGDCSEHEARLDLKETVEFTAEKTRWPIVKILTKSEDKSYIFGAIPASFGADIDSDFRLNGYGLFFAPKSGCSPQSFVLPKSGIDFVAFVDRGDCEFTLKARNAQKAGFKALVILDTKDHTGFDRIIGHDETVEIPVVFLRKSDADKVRAGLHLAKPGDNKEPRLGVIPVTIEDSSAIFKNSSKNGQDSPGLSTGSKSSGSESERIVLDFDDEADNQVFRPLPAQLAKQLNDLSHKKKVEINVYPKSEQPPPIINDSDDNSTFDSDSNEGQKSGFSPVMIAFFFIVAALVAVTLSTAVIYVWQCFQDRNRRRDQRTRCQEAIREMEAYYKRHQGNSRSVSRRSSAKNSPNLSTCTGRHMPLDVASAARILECPVCLEKAWPPLKIYQCMQGHILCHNCLDHPQMTSCPICRQVLRNRFVSRNLALENLASTLYGQMNESSSRLNSGFPSLDVQKVKDEDATSKSTVFTTIAGLEGQQSLPASSPPPTASSTSSRPNFLISLTSADFSIEPPPPNLRRLANRNPGSNSNSVPPIPLVDDEENVTDISVIIEEDESPAPAYPPQAVTQAPVEVHVRSTSEILVDNSTGTSEA